MSNITTFDGIILLLVLLAMLLATQPKRSAMSVCLIVTSLGMFLNYSVHAGYLGIKEFFPLVAIIQIFAASCLLISVRWLKIQDRLFFAIMGYLLIVSGVVNLAVAPGLIIETAYVATSHAISAIHVATMLMYSDGFVDIIRNIRDFVFRHSFSRLSFR